MNLFKDFKIGELKNTRKRRKSKKKKGSLFHDFEHEVPVLRKKKRNKKEKKKYKKVVKRRRKREKIQRDINKENSHNNKKIGKEILEVDTKGNEGKENFSDFQQKKLTEIRKIQNLQIDVFPGKDDLNRVREKKKPVLKENSRRRLKKLKKISKKKNEKKSSLPPEQTEKLPLTLDTASKKMIEIGFQLPEKIKIFFEDFVLFEEALKYFFEKGRRTTFRKIRERIIFYKKK